MKPALSVQLHGVANRYDEIYTRNNKGKKRKNGLTKGIRTSVSSVPLWYVDHFELKAIETQETEAKLLPPFKLPKRV